MIKNNLNPNINLDKSMIFLEMNEINFDYVKKYLELGNKLENFKKIFSFKNINTISEENYDEIEPWIQWHSIHTGKTYSEHGIFRLGDGIKCKYEGIYKELEKSGFSVGAISPMNLKNNLDSPNFFIPDPWTKTKSDNNWWSKKLHQLLTQAVNDNVKSKITLGNLLRLTLAFILFSRAINYNFYFKLIISSLLGKRWNKALFLDLFLCDYYFYLIKKYPTNFSSLFINGGAHIQHHYLFNSSVLNNSKNPEWYVKKNDDPILEMLKVYDRILGNIMELKYPFIVATGMSQQINEKKEFYYRLGNHQNFLNKLDITYDKLNTRMSRDFEIVFKTNKMRDHAYEIISSLFDRSSNMLLFEEIELREKSLFVTLTYCNELRNDSIMEYNQQVFKLKNELDFIAVKNGKHQSKGYLFYSNHFNKYVPSNNSHVAEIYRTIKFYFGLRLNN